MGTGKKKSFLLFQHPIADYIRVTAIVLIVLLALFVLRLFGSRENSENKPFRSYNKLAETINYES